MKLRVTRNVVNGEFKQTTTTHRAGVERFPRQPATFRTGRDAIDDVMLDDVTLHVETGASFNLSHIATDKNAICHANPGKAPCKTPKIPSRWVRQEHRLMLSMTSLTDAALDARRVAPDVDLPSEHAIRRATSLHRAVHRGRCRVVKAERVIVPCGERTAS